MCTLHPSDCVAVWSLALSHTNKIVQQYYVSKHREVAKIAFQDVYLTILDVDGMAAADRLRQRMEDSVQEFVTSEQSWLLQQKSIEL